jgi:hypothetical protein
VADKLKGIDVSSTSVVSKDTCLRRRGLKEGVHRCLASVQVVARWKMQPAGLHLMQEDELS